MAQSLRGKDFRCVRRDNTPLPWALPKPKPILGESNLLDKNYSL